MSSDKDILSEAKEAYRLGLDAERDNRDRFQEDYRFSRFDDHWPEDVRKRREKDMRPCLTIPKLQAFIRQVVNEGRQNRPRIKAKPADSFADPKTAQVIDGLILNIENSSNASIAYDTALDCSVSGGFGYFRIDVDYAHNSSFDKEIKIERIANPLTVVGDPYSQCADSSDWNSGFVTTILTKDEFAKKYKGASGSNWLDADYRLMDQPWMNGDEVLLAEWWKRDQIDKLLLKMSDGRILSEDVYLKQAEMFLSFGITPIEQRKTKGYKVTQYLMTGAEVLETVNWPGCYIPIVPVYGEEINIDGKRVLRSLIAPAKDAQRRYNYWVSAATELVALAPKTPYIGDAKAFTHEPDKWETVNTTSHPYIAVPNGTPIPQRQPLDGGQAIGAISQAMAASDDIKAILGMYDASLGQRSNETSGKAILARQREGDTSTFHFLDNLARGIQHAGRIIVDLIPSVYTPGMVVRVLGHDGRAATAQVQNAMPGTPPPKYSPLDEKLPEDAQFIYDFGLGRYDVMVDTGPSYTTKREETAEQMIAFMQAYPPVVPLLGDKLAKNLDWQDAEEIGERLKSMIPPQAQGGPTPEMMQMQEQMQQMGQQMEMVSQQSQQSQMEIAVLKAEKTLADKQHKLDLAEKDLTIQHLQHEQAVGQQIERVRSSMAVPEPKAAPVSINMAENLGQEVAQALVPAVTQAVTGAIASLPPLRVEAPPVQRMKRTPVRNKQTGLIDYTIDEPVMEGARP